MELHIIWILNIFYVPDLTKCYSRRWITFPQLNKWEEMPRRKQVEEIFIFPNMLGPTTVILKIKNSYSVYCLHHKWRIHNIMTCNLNYHMWHVIKTFSILAIWRSFFVPYIFAKRRNPLNKWQFVYWSQIMVHIYLIYKKEPVRYPCYHTDQVGFHIMISNDLFIALKCKRNKTVIVLDVDNNKTDFNVAHMMVWNHELPVVFNNCIGKFQFQLLVSKQECSPVI